MTPAYDVIIAGLGAMGSAAAFHLARAGLRVLGLDRFNPPHTLGSSHGESRIIREAYFEHPAYVPLVQRAFELWEELAAAPPARRLLLLTGGLMIGPPDGVVVSGARRSAELHGLAFESLSGLEVARRFPALCPREGMSAVWEPRAGVLFPEECVKAHLEAAQHAGATLQFDEPVLRWRAEGGGVRVVSAKDEYIGGRLVISAGSWVQSLLPELPLGVTVERQVLYWFAPACQADDKPDGGISSKAGLFAPALCPIYLWEYERGQFFYGFPDLGAGVKVALHHQGEVTAPEAARREVGAEEVEAIRKIIRPLLPGLGRELLRTAVCLYTNTRDEHFLIDAHPLHPQVLIVSPCSGHGFKFSSAIGEVVRDLVVTGRSRFDLSLFRLR